MGVGVGRVPVTVGVNVARSVTVGEMVPVGVVVARGVNVGVKVLVGVAVGLASPPNIFKRAMVV